MPEQTDTPTPDTTELDRLRQHNRELLAELKTARGEAKTAQDALEAAQGASNEWRGRWYKAAIEKPLEDQLSAVAACPWRYARDVFVDEGLLKMEMGEDGIERPTWYDETGNKVDTPGDLYTFLSGVHRRTASSGSELGRVLRGSGASGSGSGPSASVGRFNGPKPETKPEPEKPSFGLR